MELRCYIFMLMIFFFYRNPNNGILKVPVNWPEFTPATQQFLDISAKMNGSSVREKMRHNFVQLWTKTLPSLKSHDAAVNQQ